MSQNITDTELAEKCPGLQKSEINVINDVRFYVEGVSLPIVATLGIIFNLLSSVILVKKDMRNSFNILLVILAAYDTWYMFGAILETIRKFFMNLRTHLHLRMFPHFLYPLHQTSITGSIFMTVALAFERYSALNYPMEYNRALTEDYAMKIRVLKYLIPGFSLSFIFSIPKFFESRVKYSNNTILHQNITLDNIPQIELTELRTHPWYSTYNSWSRLFVLGIIPFVLLVIFNTKIYFGIKKRKAKKKDLTRPVNSRSCASRGTVKCTRKQLRSNGIEMSPLNEVNETKPVAHIVITEATTEEDEPSSNNRQFPLRKSIKDSLKKARRKFKSGNHPGASLAVNEENGEIIEDLSPMGSSQNMSQLVSKKGIEDSIARVFIVIIFIFLICHLPRILLDVYELAIVDKAQFCAEHGNPDDALSFWPVILICVSHLFLVISSSTNMIVYCLLGTKFRMEAKKTYKSIFQTICGCCSFQNRATDHSNCIIVV